MLRTLVQDIRYTARPHLPPNTSRSWPYDVSDTFGHE